MRRLLIALLAASTASAFAVDNSLFQEFDNQVSVGYGMNQMTSSFGSNIQVANSNVIGNTNIVNLEAERLLNDGIWIDVNANMAFGAGPISNLSPYMNSSYGVNAKVGYAFPLLGQRLQLTPYILAGLNNTSSMISAIPASNVSANQFAYTGGVGGRVEYRITRSILVYADQLAAYNWDQSGPQAGVMPQNTVNYTSTIGAKFNLAQNFQVGVRGFYTVYDNQATNGYGNIYYAQPQSSVGGLISVGLTY